MPSFPSQAYRDKCHPDDCYPAYEIWKSSKVEGPFPECALAKSESAEDWNSITAGQNIPCQNPWTTATVVDFEAFWMPSRKLYFAGVGLQQLLEQLCNIDRRNELQVPRVTLHEGCWTGIDPHLIYNPMVEIETYRAKKVPGHVQFLHACPSQTRSSHLCSLLAFASSQAQIYLFNIYLLKRGRHASTHGDTEVLPQLGRRRRSWWGVGLAGRLSWPWRWRHWLVCHSCTCSSSLASLQDVWRLWQSCYSVQLVFGVIQRLSTSFHYI